MFSVPHGVGIISVAVFSDQPMIFDISDTVSATMTFKIAQTCTSKSDMLTVRCAVLSVQHLISILPELVSLEQRVSQFVMMESQRPIHIYCASGFVHFKIKHYSVLNSGRFQLTFPFQQLY